MDDFGSSAVIGMIPKEEVGTLYQSNIHYELDDIPLIGFTLSKFAPIHSKSLLFANKRLALLLKPSSETNEVVEG